MSSPNVVIAAITAYQSAKETRFQLAKKMVENAVEAGYHVVLIDDSANGVWDILKEAGAVVYAAPEKGMGNAKRESVQKAESYVRRNFPDLESIILLIEPEKESIVKWIPNIIAPITKGQADLVILRRNEESWKSFPWFQMESEKVCNLVYREVTGIDADPMLGPVAFRSDLSKYFTSCQPLTHYGMPDNYIQHVAPMEALHDGYRIEAVEIGFIYPLEQKTEEEGPKFAEMVKKRLWQQKQLIETYLKVGKTLQFIT